jgi:hypothetical protein
VNETCLLLFCFSVVVLFDDLARNTLEKLWWENSEELPTFVLIFALILIKKTDLTERVED